MFWFTALFACSPLPPCGSATGRVSISNPNADAPLAYRLEVSEGDPVSVEVDWQSDDHAASISYDASATHAHTLVGWRPGRTYEVSVRLDGRRAERCVVDTPALPDTFPDADVLVADSERSEPGDTLVTMRIQSAPGQAQGIEAVAVYDADGEVLWYRLLSDLAQVVYETHDGLLVMYGMGTSARVSRMAWSGVETDTWTVSSGSVNPTRAGNFHHDAIEDPDVPGRVVGLVRSAERVEDWPRSHQEPDALVPTDVSFETVVTFDPDGTVVDEVDLADLVPLERHGCDSLSQVAPEGWADWAHANALVVDGDQMMVSLRNQDAVIAYGRDDASLRWVLGHPANWGSEQEAMLLQPVDPSMQWFWHAHAPSFGPDLPDGRRQLLLFDNGNYGAAPPPHDRCRATARAGRSRVVGYWIDEAAGTVEEGFVLDTVAGQAAFSPAVGDADWLPGGTVLATWGMLTAPSSDRGTGAARIVEYDPEQGDEVWHLLLTSAASANPLGWNVIRADRIAGVAGRIQD